MKTWLLTLSLLLLFNLPATAQATQPQTAKAKTTPAASGSPQEIVLVIGAAPRPGSEAQYLEGRKRHLEFHRSQNDAWAWHTYEVIAGEHVGMLLTVTSPHKWADHDARAQFDRDDQADVAKNIAPYAMNPEISYWRVRTDMSRAGATESSGLASAPMFTVQHFIVDPAGVPDFIARAKQISAALDKANSSSPKGLWYQLINGGEGPHFVLVTGRKTWADFDVPIVDDTLREAAGASGTEMLAGLRRHMKRIWTETLRHNPEMSYHPAATR